MAGIEAGIRLIVGLGNPGDDYQATRHNIGFWWVDQVCTQLGTSWRAEAKFHGLSATAHIRGQGQGQGQGQAQEIKLLKPATFMNASGRAVAAICNFYKIAPHQMLVIHDELDLAPGTCKLKFSGGHGGHNGLRDIHAALGTPEYWRLRIGIGHPGDKQQVANFVLKAPGKAEHEAIQQSIDHSIPLLGRLLQGEFERAMLELHSKKQG